LAWRWSAASKRKGPAAAGGRKDETKIRSLLDGGVVGVGAVRQRYHEERSVRAAASEKREGGRSGSNPLLPVVYRGVSGGLAGLSPLETGLPNGPVVVSGGFNPGRTRPKELQVPWF
jgi:hypothetical protein